MHVQYRTYYIQYFRFPSVVKLVISDQQSTAIETEV